MHPRCACSPGGAQSHIHLGKVRQSGRSLAEALQCGELIQELRRAARPPLPPRTPQGQCCCSEEIGEDDRQDSDGLRGIRAVDTTLAPVVKVREPRRIANLTQRAVGAVEGAIATPPYTSHVPSATWTVGGVAVASIGPNCVRRKPPPPRFDEYVGQRRVDGATERLRARLAVFRGWRNGAGLECGGSAHVALGTPLHGAEWCGTEAAVAAAGKRRMEATLAWKTLATARRRRIRTGWARNARNVTRRALIESDLAACARRRAGSRPCGAASRFKTSIARTLSTVGGDSASGADSSQILTGPAVVRR
eukprot:5513707-Prymnesium_polylepis.1